MPTIYIDNQPYQVKENQNLLEAGLSLKLDIPYFCWHPAMGSVGACRLCAVKQFQDAEDTQGQLVMSCMTPAADGTRISINNPEAQQFRRSVLEWLMVNHPHDCPICDEGGECHLQDMTVMTGQTYREFRFKKRTYRNQYLGPLINHEMNRCIQCYRCVRFYNDYAGCDDLKAFAAHDHVYFGRHQDGVLQSEFSGNLVEVCPTGVFTDKTLKQHYTRKWDLQTAPSICTHCGVGCNTIPGERYGTLRRIRNRYNGQVNRYFLCDRGRYGYEFVNSPERIRQPLLRRDQGFEPVEKATALQHIQTILRNSNGIIGIGSSRASLEANFALQTLVGADNFCAGLSLSEQHLIAQIIEILQTGPARSPSLYEMQQADAVLVLGEDLTNTAPMVALALRQSVRKQPLEVSRSLDIPDWHDAAVREAIQGEKGPLFMATPTQTNLADVATQTFRATPADIARLGFAVAHALDGDAPPVPELSAELRELAETIAKALEEAERPLVVSGVSLGSKAVIQAAANVAWALCKQNRPAELSFVVPESNSLGLGLIGGHTLDAALVAVQEGTAETVIILENDLYRRTDTETANSLLEAAKHVITLDYLPNATTAQAEVVIPAATFAEGHGTLVNSEGRAQRFFQAFAPEGAVEASWRWLKEMLHSAGRAEGENWCKLDDVITALAETLPVFESIPEIAPPAAFRVAGQRIPRQPHRYSGRTAMRANISLHEPQPPQDEDSPLSFSMEGYQDQPPPSLINHFWSPGWNSVQAVNKFQSEIGGPLHGGDPGRRLLEPAGVSVVTYYDNIPSAFESQPEKRLIVPLYHIFGSEPYSLHTPGIAQLAPQPYLALNPTAGESLQLEEGQQAGLRLDGSTVEFPIKFLPTLPPGVVGLPVGLPGVPTVIWPKWGSVVVAEGSTKGV